MKLLSGKIYGFAKWVDYEIDFSKDPFTVIYGENETGKTSLHKFILFMLFGLPPKQRTFYRPKHSSKMGGRLTLHDPKVGEFTIERLDETRNGAAICLTPNGQTYDETWLQKRLDGMSEETYHSIFSFSSLDLAKIRTMKEEDMGEMLLGIGLTGSAHIYSIEKRLEAKLAQLFKPYGKNPMMNQQLQSLQDKQKSLLSMQQEEAKYREKKSKLIDLNSESDLLKDQLRDGKEKVIRIEKELQALPSIHEYHTYTSQLASLPQEIPFPKDGLARFQVMKDKLIPLRSEMSVLTTNEKKLIEEKNKLTKLLETKPDYQRMSTLVARTESHKDREREIDKLEEAIQKLNLRTQAELEDWNIGLTYEDLNGMALPFHTEKAWKDIKNTRDQLQLEKEKINEEIHLTEEKKKLTERQLYEIEAGLLKDEHRTVLKGKLDDYNENKLLERLHQEEQVTKDMWKKNRINTTNKTNKYLLVSIVIAIAISFVAFFMDSFMLVNLAALSLLLGIGQWGWGRKSLRDLEKVFIHATYTTSNSSITEQEKEEASRIIALDDDNNNERKALQQQIKSITVQLMQYEEKQTVLAHKKRRLHDTIEEQYQLYPFLRQTDISYWPEIYQGLKNLLRTQRERDELKRELDLLKDKHRSWKGEIDTFLKEENKPVYSTMDHSLQLVKDEIIEIEKYKQSIIQIEQSLVDNRKQQDQLGEEIVSYEKEVHSLFTIANVDNEDEYYHRANQLKQQQELIIVRGKIATQYKSIFQREEWQRLVEKTPKQSQLEIELQLTEEKMNEFENELYEVQQKKADLKSDLLKLESSEAYSKLLHQFQMEKEEFNKTAKEWTIYQTAKELLAETKRNYRNKYLSKVMKQTKVYFNELTGGAYLNVIAPTDETLFLVEHQDHIHYTVNELSQGTMDQLYVSLRLAIGELMTKNNQIPFIIDDAFVHFDTVRTDRVLKILASIAKKQQVILFSCKPEIMETNYAEVIKLGNLVPLINNK